MALAARHHEQQLTANLNDDITNLENDYSLNKYYPYEEKGKGNIETLSTDRYKLSDLLNGLIDDNNTLKAFDECLHIIVSEYNGSNILKVQINQLERLLRNKCNTAYSQILNTVNDSNVSVFDTLLRITRKIKAIDLVVAQQKMIHIPHEPEAIQSILEESYGQNTNTDKPKTPPKGSESPMVIYDEETEQKTEELIPNITDLGKMKSDLSRMHGLKDLVLKNRKRYTKTHIYQTRDKKKRTIGFEQIGIGRNRGASKSKPKSQKKDAKTVELTPNSHTPNSPHTPMAQKQKKTGHPMVKCEGCSNDIILNTEYDKCLTYDCAIIGEKLFYFHSEFCVTLRRIKESVRRFVLDDSLAETERAKTTIGYIRNLLTNFNTLINIKCVIPKPEIFGVAKQSMAMSMAITFDKEKENKKNKTRLMSMTRDNAWKLILMKQALDGKGGKNFEEDYEWKFEQIPRLIQYTNMSIYGESLYAFVTAQLQIKQWDALWLLLAFIGSTMNTTKSLQLLQNNSDILCKVKDITHLDVLCTSMIESADFAIAMALFLSAFMENAANNDLSRSEDFEEISERYVRIATNLVDNIESSHLLALLLETPTDITPNKLNVFEIALEYQIESFMHSSRIQMLMASMWSQFDFLNPQKMFRTTDISLFETCRVLIRHPATFYYCPVGRFYSESVAYIVYIILVTIVMGEGNYNMRDSLSTLEWIMWIFNAGFIFNEVLQLVLEGFYKYITDVGNIFDVAIMINWTILFLFRFFCRVLYFRNWEKQCTGDHNKNATIIYSMVWGFQIIILWSRTSMIFRRSRSIGPFLTMIPGMIKDILNWAFVLGIFFIGFCFGVNFIIAGDINPNHEGCEIDGEGLKDFSVVMEYIFMVVIGMGDFGYLEPNGCIDNKRSLILKFFLWFFAILGTILLLNLLIAMMSSTYERIREGTAKQVNFTRAELTYALAHKNAIIPPPLNGIAVMISLIWFFFELILYLLSCCNYYTNIELIVPFNIDYNTFDGHSSNQSKKTVFRKLDNSIKDNLKNWKKTNTFCRYCRGNMKQNGDISDYFELFRDYKLDEGDTKFIQSLLQNDTGICPQCYRPFVKFDEIKSNRLFRWEVILELVSFYTFMIFLYIPLIILIALPALLNGGVSTVGNIQKPNKETVALMNKKKSVFKDEKYLQLIENVIEEETLENDDLVSLQMQALHKKLAKVNVNQINTNANVERQSVLINDRIIPTLMSLIPYIKNIDTKMDKSMANTTHLHQKQLDVFMKSVDTTTEMSNLQNRQLMERQNEMQKSQQLKHEKEMQLLQQQLSDVNQSNVQNKEILQNYENLHQEQQLQHKEEMQLLQQQNKGILDNLQTDLQNKLEIERSLRENEQKKFIEEQNKNNLLTLQKEKELQIAQIEMQHLALLKQLKTEKAEIDEKLSENLDKTIDRIENEILECEQSEESLSAGIVSDLQTQLTELRGQQSEMKQSNKTAKERKELTEIQNEKELNLLKEKMEIINRERAEMEQKTLQNKLKNEEKNMKYLISIQKLTNSIDTLQFDQPLTSLELANICNLDLKEAETLMEVYDVNGDGVLDANEFNDLKNEILVYQKEFRSTNMAENSETETENKTEIESVQSISKKEKKIKVNYDGFIAQRKALKDAAKAGQKTTADLRKELLKLTQTKLARKCREANLSSKGTKADLVNRLMKKQKQSKKKSDKSEENDENDDDYQE